MKRCILIGGDRRSGKTETCRRLFFLMRKLGMDPYGIVEESGRDESGIPVSLHFHELTSGKVLLLGTRAARGGDGSYPPFLFRQGAFEWANSAVRTGLSTGNGPMILDEIGPLELARGEGLLPAVKMMAGGAKHHILFTVRTDLLSRMEAMLAEHLDGAFPLSVFRLAGGTDGEPADAAARAIVSLIENDNRAMDSGHGTAFRPERI